MTNAIHFYKQGNIQKTSLFFKLVILGGFLFLLLKSFEYYTKITYGITLGINTFFTFY